MTRQQSIPNFTDEEEDLCQRAMEIELIPSQGQWIKRAALLWARQVVNSDQAEFSSRHTAGNTQRLEDKLDEFMRKIESKLSRQES